MSARLLLVAKAPVAGRAKTRLGRVVGMDAAAELAAAALLDTVEVATTAFPGSCHLALDGDLADAVRGSELRAALADWHVFGQQGERFGDRLAHAHGVLADLAPDPVVQIGMDTPQLEADVLLAAARAVQDGAGAAIGPAEDGGWWLLALADGHRAEVLRDVPMSASRTGASTLAALAAVGLRTVPVAALRDVDEVDDARAVALAAPYTRFAAAWQAAERAAAPDLPGRSPGVSRGTGVAS